MSNCAFPPFRPLAKKDQTLIERTLEKNPPEISEFTFTNLFAWRDVYRFEIALFDKLILLRSATNQIKKFFPPIGSGNCQEVFKLVLSSSSAFFVRVPEAMKKKLEKEPGFVFAEDRDNFDYVYTIDDLVTLKGARYDGKRNFIKRFKAFYDYEYVPVTSSNAKECLDFEKKWCSIKQCDANEGLRNERTAFEEMIKQYASFHLLGAMLKVSGQIVAVAIAQELNPTTLVVHMLKADAGFVGSYQAMVNEFLSHYTGQYQLVNFEQDLGVEGLRKSKLSYHPIRMVKKYSVSWPDISKSRMLRRA